MTVVSFVMSVVAPAIFPGSGGRVIAALFVFLGILSIAALANSGRDRELGDARALAC